MPARKSTQRKKVWFVLVEEERCRLLQAEVTKLGTPHVEEHDAFENRHPQPELGRPQALGGMTGHSYAAPHHKAGERVRRFMKESVNWLTSQMAERQIERLVIFATPRLMGALRQVDFGQAEARIELKEVNLGRLRVHELAEHQFIRQLLGLQPK